MVTGGWVTLILVYRHLLKEIPVRQAPMEKTVQKVMPVYLVLMVKTARMESELTK